MIRLSTQEKQIIKDLLIKSSFSEILDTLIETAYDEGAENWNQGRSMYAVEFKRIYEELMATKKRVSAIEKKE